MTFTTFADSGREVEVGDAGALPLPLDELAALHRGHPAVREVHEGGLTAIVYKLHAQECDWAVKRARPQCLMKNVDGQTSFLNEVQRRAELARLQSQPGGASRWRGLTPTVYASVRQGVIVSPWVDGRPMRTWSERALRQLSQPGANWCAPGAAPTCRNATWPSASKPATSSAGCCRWKRRTAWPPP